MVWRLMNPESIKTELRLFVSELLARYGQEYRGELDLCIQDRTERFESDISSLSWRLAQQWCHWTDDGPVLFPQQTRLFYRKGDTVVVVQEFPPHDRRVTCLTSLVDSPISSAHENPDPHDTSRLVLPLPYTVFISTFREGEFESMKLAFNPPT